MKLVSLNVGMPALHSYQGKQVFTSIFKSPVADKQFVSKLHIAGDEQGDLKAHGGSQKAVYAYDVSYYDTWKKILKRDDWNFGLFGENLTTEGMADHQLRIGDVYRIGTVYLQAVQPRFPCFKLNIRFGIDDMLQQFTRLAKNGTYFSVVEEGTMQAGDEITLVEASTYEVTIAQLVEAYYNKGADKRIVKQILAIPFLPARLRNAFEGFLG